MEKARKWSEAIKATVNSYEEIRDSANALISRAEIRFANGSVKFEVLALLTLTKKEDAEKMYRLL